MFGFERESGAFGRIVGRRVGHVGKRRGRRAGNAATATDHWWRRCVRIDAANVMQLMADVMVVIVCRRHHERRGRRLRLLWLLRRGRRLRLLWLLRRGRAGVGVGGRQRHVKLAAQLVVLAGLDVVEEAGGGRIVRRIQRYIVRLDCNTKKINCYEQIVIVVVQWLLTIDGRTV